MCTSIVVNKKKTVVGWNLDLKDMEWRVSPGRDGVFIEINDPKEGWMPLFGANSRGDFVGMPTCWPHDERSDPRPGCENVIMLDMDLLLKRKTLAEIRDIAGSRPVCSIPGLTFMSALSDAEGNVLHVIPGVVTRFHPRPEYCILTNFNRYADDPGSHPWMGLDRYRTAESMLREADASFGVGDCFRVLRAVSQTECPTVVSMVFDVNERTVHWCLNREWDRIERAVL